MTDPEMKTFDIIFQGTGTMSGKMRNDVKVYFETMDETYELATAVTQPLRPLLRFLQRR